MKFVRKNLRKRCGINDNKLLVMIESGHIDSLTNKELKRELLRRNQHVSAPNKISLINRLKCYFKNK